jgi:hypothetical protein
MSWQASPLKMACFFFEKSLILHTMGMPNTFKLINQIKTYTCYEKGP